MPIIPPMPEEKTMQLAIRLPASLSHNLRTKAASLGVTLTALMESILRQGLEELERQDTGRFRIETVSGRGLPVGVDIDGYDTRLAAEAMAEDCHDGEYRIVEMPHALTERAQRDRGSSLPTRGPRRSGKK